MSKFSVTSLAAAAITLLSVNSAVAINHGPAAPSPVPPPAVAINHGPAAPSPVPPPAVAINHGPAAPSPVPPPAVV